MCVCRPCRIKPDDEFVSAVPLPTVYAHFHYQLCCILLVPVLCAVSSAAYCVSNACVCMCVRVSAGLRRWSEKLRSPYAR